MGVLKYVPPVIELVRAASRVPADFTNKTAVQAWFAGMNDPLADLTVLAATDIKGNEGPYGAFEAEGLIVAFEQIAASDLTDLEKKVAKSILENMQEDDLEVISDSKMLFSEPAAAIPAWVPIVIQMAWEIIKLIRENRNKS